MTMQLTWTLHDSLARSTRLAREGAVATRQLLVEGRNEDHQRAVHDPGSLRFPENRFTIHDRGARKAVARP